MTRPTHSRIPEALRILCLLASLLIITQIELTRHSLYSLAYLFSDESHNFLVADALLRGRILYKDIFYPYGYLPAYGYALAALIFKNSIGTYLHFLQGMSILSVVAIYAMLRSCVDGNKALLATLLAIVPQTIIPGSFSAGITGNTYHPIEMGITALCVLLWRPVGAQTIRRAFMLGVLLGLWQGVKFGGALVFGLAIILSEIMYLSTKHFNGPLIREWLIKSLTVLSGFLLIQGVWCIIAFATLEPQMARDVLFPSYMLESYQGALASIVDRYPHFISWRYFLSVQAVPIIGLAGAIWFIVSKAFYTIKHSAPDSDNTSTDNCYRLLILPVFYGLGCFIYFKQVWLYYAYAWTLTAGGIYLLNDTRKILRLLVISIWVLGFAALCKNSLLKPQEPGLVSLPLMNGEKLWVKDKEREKVDQLINLLRSDNQQVDASQEPQAIVFYPLGAGMHVFYGIPQQGRHYWFVPGFVRPYDEDALIKNLDHTKYWVILSDDPNRAVTNNPETWDNFKIKPLSLSLRARLSERLGEPIKVDDLTYVFPVKAKRAW
jgi:hypothetical protein